MPVSAAAALEVLSAGIAVVPPREDGTKQPDKTWRQYEHQPPTEQTVARWYEQDRAGIGAVTGEGSGHLEMLELEGAAMDLGMWDQLKDRMEHNGLGEVWARVTEGYLEQSPSGGMHTLFRVPTGALRNLKLARRHHGVDERGRPKVQVLIETRGQGGYTILAPTGGTVHPSGGSWVIVNGSLRTIATITAEERDAIYDVCRTFDELGKDPEAEPDDEVEWDTITAPPAEQWFGAVVADYNQSTTWAAKLIGWQEHHKRGGITYWTRPGKDVAHGHSATTNGKGTDRLIAFSSSIHYLIEPWDGGGKATSYDRFSYYAITEHDGDRLAAARQLRSEGFGPSPSTDDTPYEPVAEDDPWGPARPIPQPEPVPAWPTDIFPQWMQAQVDNVARAVECPPDIPALFGLGALAVAALGRIQIEARPGHTESTAIYGAIVAGVSEGKSPAKDAMMRPVEAYEDEAVAHGKAALANEAFERELIEDQIIGLKKQAGSGDGSAKRFAQDKIAELEDRPAPRQGRMTTSDATPERLATMMAANGDAMSVISDEAGPLAIDRYGDKTRGSNLDLYLKGWSGVRHSQDRQKAPSVLLRRPLLNFMVAAQPEAWDKAMEDVEFRTRGLGARFMTCRPAATAWMRTDDLDRDVWDNDAEGAYRTRMGDLCRRFGAWQLPATVVLSDEARTTYKLWAKRITRRTRPGGDLDHELGWSSKLKDTVIRVAGLLHMADGEDYRTPVAASVMDRACRLGDYWVGHRLHEPGTATRDAERLLGALIGLHECATGCATTPFVARRELQRRGPRGLRTVAAYTPAMSALIMLGLVRPVGSTAGENAQVSAVIKAAAGFVVHPDLLDVRHRATACDNARHFPATDTETSREAESVALVARVAISGCFETPLLTHSSVESETPGDTCDTRDTNGVSVDLTADPTSILYDPESTP